MPRNLVNGNKRAKGYFFTETAIGNNRGFLFRNDDRPPELTFRDLLENIPFFNESNDQAKLDDFSGDLYEKAGLATLATDAQAIARQTKPTDRAIAAQPSQLTSSVDVGTQDIATATDPLSGQKLVEVTRDVGVTTRSEYQTGLSAAFIAWIVSTIDGIRADIAQNVADILTLNTVTIPDLQTQIDNLSSSSSAALLDALPVGSMIDWPVNIPPAGGKWLICDGTTLADATYPDLVALIGTTFGTGGAGTFNLPDYRGKAPVYRLAGDPDFGNLNDSGGAKAYTLIGANLPPHQHEANGNGATISIGSSGSHGHTFTQYGSAADGGYPKNAKNSGGSSNTNLSGGSHSHSNGNFSGFVGNGPGASQAFSLLNPFLVGGNKIIKVLP